MLSDEGLSGNEDRRGKCQAVVGKTTQASGSQSLGVGETHRELAKGCVVCGDGSKSLAQASGAF